MERWRLYDTSVRNRDLLVFASMTDDDLDGGMRGAIFVAPILLAQLPGQFENRSSGLVSHVFRGGRLRKIEYGPVGYEGLRLQPRLLNTPQMRLNVRLLQGLRQALAPHSRGFGRLANRCAVVNYLFNRAGQSGPDLRLSSR